MDILTCIGHFIHVVDEGGFMKAARKQRVSVSSVSKHINFLETWCNAQLLHRTTRTVQLTMTGEQFYQEAKQLVDKTYALRQLPSNDIVQLQGMLRLNIPSTFNESLLLTPIFKFLQQHPFVRVNIAARPYLEELTDNTSDIVITLKKEHSVDIKACRLFEIQRGLYAAPSYLEQSAAINKLEDLKNHNCLLFNGYAGPFWHFAGGKKIRVQGSLSADYFNILIQAATAGIGIIYIAEYFIKEEVKNGSLIPILSKTQTIDAEMFAYYLRYRTNPLIENFITYLKKYFYNPAPLLLR